MDKHALLLKLIDEKFDGSQADFARAIKRSPAQVHQWVSRFRNLGEAGARNIERSLGIHGYFDGLPPASPVPSAEPPTVAETLESLRAATGGLPPEAQKVLGEMIAAYLASPSDEAALRLPLIETLLTSGKEKKKK